MGNSRARYRVAYITGSRMPDGHDWIYLQGQPSVLLLRVGADERQAFAEVAEMLDAEAASFMPIRPRLSIETRHPDRCLLSYSRSA